MEKIICEKHHDNQVWRIVLNDPKGNVIDSVMLGDLRELLNEVSQEKKCKLLVLQGAGKHFSFGVSVEEHTVELAPKMLADFHGLFLTLADLSIPVCSMISGQCLGGGLEIAAFAHFIFADESARMGQPEINLSVFAPPASVMLPMKIGQSYADDILLTGRSIDAHEARRMGLVYEVYADKETMEEKVEAWIQRYIIPKSAIALRIATKVARKRFDDRLREDLRAYEAIYLDELMKTRDALEGLDSFLENRKPVWMDE